MPSMPRQSASTAAASEIGRDERLAGARSDGRRIVAEHQLRIDRLQQHPQPRSDLARRHLIRTRFIPDCSRPSIDGDVVVEPAPPH